MVHKSVLYDFAKTTCSSIMSENGLHQLDCRCGRFWKESIDTLVSLHEIRHQGKTRSETITFG